MKVSFYSSSSSGSYSGSFLLIHSIKPSFVSFTDPRYYTFKQIKDLDLKLKKGSKGVQVQFYRLTTKETKKLDKNGQTIDVQIPFIRLTQIFNLLKGVIPRIGRLFLH
jgi:antirestriction protein ArdC